jgi:hypothetical protein
VDLSDEMRCLFSDFDSFDIICFDTRDGKEKVLFDILDFGEKSIIFV